MEYPTSYEIDLVEAKQAISEGEAEPIAAYLRDVVKGLKLLSTLADPSDGSPPRMNVAPSAEQQNPADATDEEWLATTDQVEEGIEQGSATIVGWYLRDVSEILDMVANALGTRNGTDPAWKLQFVRSRAGRPTKPHTELASAIRTELKLRKMRGEPVKVIVDDLCNKHRLSRATIMRAYEARSKSESRKRR